jgi:hypothetical protein
MLTSTEWSDDQADSVFYTDACLYGLAWWTPDSRLAGQCRIDPSGRSHGIFYFEALAVLQAIRMARRLMPHARRILIYCDNTNTVDAFASLRTIREYNAILLSAVEELIYTDTAVRVIYISSAQNRVADALSRFENEAALSYVPGLSICSFQPPRLVVGATQK